MDSLALTARTARQAADRAPVAFETRASDKKTVHRPAPLVIKREGDNAPFVNTNGWYARSASEDRAEGKPCTASLVEQGKLVMSSRICREAEKESKSAHASGNTHRSSAL